ncbi:MAG TPA: DUF2147 domain-containing protein [Chryseolinea sp.]|nr:DUF2147 domain-containing protein [Chryseolinea sp.]
MSRTRRHILYVASKLLLHPGMNYQKSIKSIASGISLFLLLGTSGFTVISPAERLIGVWESEEKNLLIEISKEDDHFVGTMTWFQCATETIMRTTVDSENPDPRLVDRKLLGLKLVEKLTYQGDDIWDGGKIYDPNSGYTYDARIQLTSANTAVVRGYWKFRWLGRSMVFNRRLESSSM